MVRYAYEFKDYEFGIYWDSWAIDEEKGAWLRGNEKARRPLENSTDRGEITWNWGKPL